MPLDVKVVLFGERMLYYLLHAYDPEFAELFKVAADFDDHFERNGDIGPALRAPDRARWRARNKLLPFDRGAVARVIEHGARLAGEADKLSAHIQSSWSTCCAKPITGRARQGTQAVTARRRPARDRRAASARADRLQERVQEEILRGTVLIDTDGAKVGQVNGLSVIDLGDSAFAQPSRITATTRLGEGEVVDIEREAELGGAIHSKGVMILSAFLAARYARNRPLSLSASLVFEQSYGEVEGDSASLAELCALLSAWRKCRSGSPWR